ncbi:lipase family protein [Nocardioides sp. Iso805N]|uniref:lipase family protein n=1 Tax=Nocardioides sp. Iso805N TaxID=1283287 RepID=UPI000380C38C|nr:lipase family protein [Nocardioides sp. Iso805N]
MSLLTRAAATLAAASVVLAPTALALSPAHAADPAVPLPSSDSFYTIGSTTLGSHHPGDVLGSRTVGLTLNDLNGKIAAASGTQLVYRTKNELGDPSETVTTVVRPVGVSRGVVAYLSFYDGLGVACDPSYTLRGGAPGQEKFIVNELVSEGYTVTIPDFEGETLDWAAGHEAGWGTLDAIRATERYLGLPAASTKVGMMGYSGGSIAGDWASELAHAYAPELDLAATAIGGVPVDLGAVMGYVDSDSDSDRNSWAGVIPAAMVSLGRAYGEDFTQYLSSTPTYPEATPTKSGQDIAAEVADKCISDFAATYTGLHVADLLDPSGPYTSLTEVPGVQPIIHNLVMGNSGTPTMPMLIVQGRDSDGIGDGVMVADDVKALAAKYQAAGTPVQYEELAGDTHTQAGLAWTFASFNFLGTQMPVLAAPVPQKPAAIHAAIKGHSQGKKDVIVVTAKGAAGAKVTITKAGHAKVLGHGVIGANGKVTIKVRDHNGSAKTRYRGHVAATTKTSSATTKVLKLR